ncbi:MAG: hypothetical protein AB7L94_11860 [Kofleriaceae bacterium]
MKVTTMMNVTGIRLVIAAILLIGIRAGTAHAVPATMPIQGTLTRTNGLSVNGPQVVRFRIYDAATGGAALHDETQTIETEEGAFTAYLGKESPLPLATFASGSVWLGISVGTDEEMTPRFELGTVPYAAVCEESALLGGMPPSAFASTAHDHAGEYLPIGTAPTCPGTQKMTGIAGTGDAVCAPDVDTTYTAGGGLALEGGAFSIPDNGVTTARIANAAVTTAKIGNDQVTGEKLQDILPPIRTVFSTNSANGTPSTALASTTEFDLCTLTTIIISHDGSCTLSIAGSLWRLVAGSSPSGGTTQCGMTCYAW